jgi:hypothetical protein
MSDRKYKQRGYQESGAPAPRERESGSEPPRERGPAAAPHQRLKPGGRGFGAPTEAVFRCARCGGMATVAEAMAPGAKCAGCGNDLHTCTNCAAFDTGARFECRREIPARVSPKDKANVCPEFEPRERQEFAQEKAAPPKPNDARAAFDALFKI